MWKRILSHVDIDAFACVQFCLWFEPMHACNFGCFQCQFESRKTLQSQSISHPLSSGGKNQSTHSAETKMSKQEVLEDH